MQLVEIQNSIMSELGYPMVKVELDQTMWAGIFQGAKRWFQARKGVIRAAMVSGMQEFPLPDDGESPIDVIFSNEGCGSSFGSIATLGFFPDIVPADFLYGGGFSLSAGAIHQADYLQTLQALEMMRRLTSTDNSWEWDYARRLILTTGGSTGLYLVYYKKTLASWEIPELRDRDEDFIYRRCMIEAKVRLARIRGKFSSYQTAGGEQSMDADVLREEAKDDAEKLDEEIALSAMPINIITG